MKWDNVTLGEILTLEYGKGLKRGNRIAGGKYPVLGSNGIDGYHNKAIIDGPGIVVGRKGSAGKVTLVEKNFWPIDTTFYVKPKIKLVLKWLYYLLSYLRLDKKKIVTGVPGLNRNNVYSIPIMLPSPSEQRKIVEILDQADRLRKLRAEADQKAERILPALFYKMFGDPATNPMEWPTERLDKVVEIGTKLIDPNKSEYHDLVHIGGEHIEKESGRLLILKHVRDSNLRSNKFTFTDKHVLYSKIRPYLNKVAYPRLNGVCSADIYPLLPKRNLISPWFLIALLRSPAFLAYAKIHSERLRMPKLNQEQLGSFIIPMPDYSVQLNFEKKAIEICKINSNRMSQNKNISNLYDNLLHRAFSGDLTAKWREAHMKDLLVEMEEQAKAIKEIN